MNLKKIAKRVHKIAPSVKVEDSRGCVRLTGELESWDEIYRCGVAAVDKKSLGVLNDIRLKGFEEKIKTPPFSDDAIDGATPDVLVIGGGIMGCALARELARLDIDVLLVEKASDVATGASSRNDGCIHPGIDLHKGQLKLHYVLRGNAMYSKLCDDLGCDFERWAQTFMFSTKWESRIIAPLMLLKGKILGVPDMHYMSPARMREIEPHPPKWLTGAVYMASAGVVSPYKVTIALAENAVENGAKISLNTIVQGMDVSDGVIKAVRTNRGTVRPKIVVNAAGAYSDVIAEMAGDRTFTIHPRKGTDLILDKKKAYYALSSFARSYFAPLPPEAREESHAAVGHTKGGGVMRTVDGNILVGPNAVEQPYREDTTTNLADILALCHLQEHRAGIAWRDEEDGTAVLAAYRGIVVEPFEHTGNAVHLSVELNASRPLSVVAKHLLHMSVDVDIIGPSDVNACATHRYAEEAEVGAVACGGPEHNCRAVGTHVTHHRTVHRTQRGIAYTQGFLHATDSLHSTAYCL